MQNPNSSKLALRDPAMAALMGAIAIGGADFGADSFGDFGDDAGDDAGADYGDDAGDDAGDEMADDVAAEVAADFGDEIGAAVRMALKGRARARAGGRTRMATRPRAARPTTAAANPAAIQAWNRMRQVQMKSAARGALLDPNRGSTVKVEEYELPMSEAIVIGSPQTFIGLSTTPQTIFKPEALVCNAPMTGYAFIQDIKAANVSASVSNFITDAYNYNPQATRSRIALPRLMPQTTVSITGQYTGAIPPGVLAGSPSFFTATLYGPSTLAGG